ncbi:blast:Luciferin 4-monooxygenase [Drosophila guanche]|uniref:Blast:Luciferin 4-monooxygenase n=1 Tax=Drosophila guanche TaxID=7266 RepID=A0A3B0K916_DROGU|nr:blast:Luciferin 4-monooxygenase [Drosophila guanche]
MPYKPQITFDDNSKVWSGGDRSIYFAPHLSIGEIIFREMERHPKLIAQISATEKTVLTRAEVRLNAIRVASYMRGLGLKQTDIVGLIARNTTHLVAVAYACFFNGMPFHSLNISYEQETIEKLFSITRPRLIFCDGDEYETQHRRWLWDFDLRLFSSRSLVPSDTVQYTHSTLDWFSGLSSIINAGVFSTTNIVADNDFDPAFMCRMIQEYKIGLVFQCPSHMAMLANCPEFDDADLSSIEHYIFGGSRCSLDIQNRLRSRLKGELIFSYSITELNSTGTLNPHFDEKPNSVGRPVPGNKMKIVNEQGVAVGPNEVGEVCLFNGQHWSGYYGDPEETRTIRDSERWFHTGDVGYVDEDGFLFIDDRKKDMLKYQNIMYYPSEIETVVSQMPNVAEVCVFGIWNAVNGDEAAASVVKRHGTHLQAQDVSDFVREHIGAKYKQLNAGVIIVDDLKRSGNGKTNRRANKEHFLNVQRSNQL